MLYILYQFHLFKTQDFASTRDWRQIYTTVYEGVSHQRLMTE